MLTKKVAIIHPWMPQYRAQFFVELERHLKDKGIELHVFYGETPPEWAARKDTVASSTSTKLPTRFFAIGGRNLVSKNLKQVTDQGPYDALILEQAVRNLETYRAFVLGKRLALRRAFWGHGRTYTEPRSPLEERLKLELTKRSDWFFGYTEGGVQHLINHGYPESRTTVLRNSMDSQSFASSLQSVTADAVRNFKSENDLQDRTALYIGGVDASKRLDFLVAAGDIVHRQDASFRLLVVGAGSQSEWLAEEAGSRPWLRILGPSTGDVKSLAFRSAQVLAIPGRVGLVAVDSLVAGTPVITTKWPFHAPEFEYLENGRTCLVTEDTIDDYSRVLLAAITDTNRLQHMARECKLEAPKYSIETMALNFAAGVSTLVQ